MTQVAKIIDDINASNGKYLEQSMKNVNEFYYLDSNDNFFRCILTNFSKSECMVVIFW